MTYGVWLSTAGMQVSDYRQSIMANNLANVDTVGFKSDLAVIQERAMESQTATGEHRFAHPILDGMTGGAWVQPTVHTFAQGAMEQTDNPLDVAIMGDGFLTVQDGSDTRYSRDGRMTLNPEGELVMVAGGGRARVLDSDGQAIRFDPDNSAKPSISNDGTIRQGEDIVAKLGIVDFADRSRLTKLGANLYHSHGEAGTPSDSRVHNGYVELSTADPIKGLASMIEVSRAYEMNARMISLQDQTIGQAVSRVGRIG